VTPKFCPTCGVHLNTRRYRTRYVLTPKGREALAQIKAGKQAAA